MGRVKVYTEEERRQRKREAQRRYYRDNKNTYQRAQMRHWIKKLTEAGYTVIAPGGETP